MKKNAMSILLLLALVLTVAACGPSPSPQITLPVVTEAVPPPPTRSVPTAAPDSGTGSDDGYPVGGVVPGGEGPGYPIDTGIGELSDTLPDPALSVPQPVAGSASVGGVLVREFEGQQYAPLIPQQLILAEIITDTASGEPAFVRYNELSPRAETFDTGIFIFNDVVPGRYGLIVNLGFTEFPVTQDDGNYLLVDIAPNQALDLGQVIVSLP